MTIQEALTKAREGGYHQEFQHREPGMRGGVLGVHAFSTALCTKRPTGGLLKPQPMPQGPARGAVEAYVPRLITSPSS
jgi:hypothetical protein